jgi:hypothetical protein
MYDYGTAIVVAGQMAIAAGFVWIALFFSDRVRWRVGRALLTWPFYGLALIFGSSAIVTLYWNMFGPIVRWVLGLVISK